MCNHVPPETQMFIETSVRANNSTLPKVRITGPQWGESGWIPGAKGR